MDAEWLCTECLSLNGRRSDRCYRCRTPRIAAEAIEGVREPKHPTAVTEPAQIGVPVAVKGAPPYRSARPYANAAMALIVAATLVTVIHFVLAALAARSTLNAAEPVQPAIQALCDEFGCVPINSSPLGIITDAISLDPSSNDLPIALTRLLQVAVVGAAIVVWGLRLSRAVENVPSLGGGWPSLTPGWAFFLCLIPGVNLIRPAGMVRELFERIPGPTGAGTGLVSIWWIALFVGAVLQVPRLGSAIIRRAISFLVFVTSGSQHDALRIELVLNGIGVILSIAAAVLAVQVVSTLQARLEERAVAGPELAASPSGAS